MTGTPPPDGQNVSHTRVFTRSLVEESTLLLARVAIVVVCAVLGYLVGGAGGMWLGLLLGFFLAGAAWLVFIGWGLTKAGKAAREARRAQRR